MNRQAMIFLTFVIGCVILWSSALSKNARAQGTAPDTALAGTWITRGPGQVATFALKADGTYRIDLMGDSRAEVEGTYTRTGENIRFTDTGGPLACSDEGRYTFHLKDESLLFSPVEDPCAGRMTTITLVEWANKDRLDTYEANIVRTPKDATAYVQRGRLRLIMGATEDAAHDFEQALVLDPDNARAYSGRAAWKLLNGNDLEGALADFDRALTLDPKNGMLYFRRAFVKWHAGDKSGSCEDLKAAMALGVPLEQKYETNCR